MFSSMVSEGNTLLFCGTYPTPRDTSRCAGAEVMSSPRSVTAPERTGISPNSVLSRVDLPAPFGPMMPTSSPSCR
jgi:hypothetical protein